MVEEHEDENAVEEPCTVCGIPMINYWPTIPALCFNCWKARKGIQ